jgi:hypothetical protein
MRYDGAKSMCDVVLSAAYVVLIDVAEVAKLNK